MENTNNKTTESRFIQNDVLKAMLTLDEKQRNSLPQITIESLTMLINDEKEVNKFYEGCNDYIRAYHNMKKAVEELVKAVHKQKENICDVTIAELAEQYKNLSEEDRLEFCKEIADFGDTENPFDMLNYNWHKLMNSLRKIKA